MTIRHTVADTTLGDLTFVADDDRLIGLYYPHHWTRPSVDSFGVTVTYGELAASARR